MQGSFRLLTTVALSASLLTACGRKKQQQAEAVPPVEQRASSEAAEPAPLRKARDERDVPAVAESSAPAHPEISVPADTPVAGATAKVSPELAKSDEVYEAWFRKYNLDLNDPNMLDADPDGDGVSNRDEFMADTDPRNKNSFPPQAAAAKAASHSGLKLKSYNEVRLPVVLDSVDGETAKIKRLDQGDKVETVRVGQTMQGLGLKVERVQSRRMTDKHGSAVDASHVTLEDPETKEKTMLVKDMPAHSASSYAVLTSEDGKTSITVRQGDSFEWPQNGGSTFKVIDLRTDQAVLQEERSGKMWTVSK
ncbi:Amuc_1099 family pilus-like system protein [Verrucomicrobiota bacterium sgz303538]